MNKKTYLAVTIGPIYDTLNQARTIRELWIASYTFSLLSGICVNYNYQMKLNLLSPKKVEDDINTFGAGIYPDRIYWSLEAPLSKKDINAIQTDILESLEQVSNGTLMKDQWKSFLRIIWIQGSWNDEELKEKSFMKRLNDLMDTAELSSKWELQNQTDIITALIAKNNKSEDERPVYKWRKESLKNTPEHHQVFLPFGKVGRFPSIIEITTQKFKNTNSEWYVENIEKKISEKLYENKEEDEDEETFMKKIKKKFKDDFNVSHKYLCIIQSDGDGIGKLLNEIGNDNALLKQFSAGLNKFSMQATEKTVEYGGIPIFAGGDDLLFLAPIMHKDSESTKNVFDLMDELNELFPKCFEDINTTASLSQTFGMSISYYKHPLNEALKAAQYLMFVTAKGHSEEGKDKNAIAFKVLKHSGQYFEAELGMKSKFYGLFKKLLGNYKTDDTKFLSSVMFMLREQKFVLANIAHDSDRLLHFFDKNLNEKPHKENKQLLDAIRDLVHTQFTHHKCLTADNDTRKIDEELLDKNLKRIFACLKFIHFLRAKDEKEDDRI